MTTWIETFKINSYLLAEELKDNEYYTLSLDGNISPSSTIQLWLNDDYIGDVINKSITFVPFENIVDGELHIRYNGATEIEWVKLDKGEDAKGWLPALEEMDLDESGDLKTGTSTWILNGTSKHGWIISNGKLRQIVDISPNTEYTLAGKVLKSTPAGIVRITLNNVVTDEIIDETFFKGFESVYDGQFSFQFNSMQHHAMKLWIEVIGASTVSPIEITDLMLIEGVNNDVWRQASGESYTMNVKMDGHGIRVYSTDGRSSTVMSPEEFAGYYNNEKIFTLNGDITEVMGAYVGGKGLFIPPVKFVQTSNSLDVVWTGR